MMAITISNSTNVKPRLPLEVTLRDANFGRCIKSLSREHKLSHRSTPIHTGILLQKRGMILEKNIWKKENRFWALRAAKVWRLIRVSFFLMLFSQKMPFCRL
jgi:hypothetical protein